MGLNANCDRKTFGRNTIVVSTKRGISNRFAFRVRNFIPLGFVSNKNPAIQKNKGM